jgi:hypothetical protein
MREARSIYFSANQFGDDGGYGTSGWTSNWARSRARCPIHPPVCAPSATTTFTTCSRGTTRRPSASSRFRPGRSQPDAGVLRRRGRSTSRACLRAFSSLQGGPYELSFVDGEVARSTASPLIRCSMSRSVTLARYLALELEPPASLTDALTFCLALGASLAVGLAMMAIVVPLVPVGLVATWLLRGSRKRERAAA